MKAIIKNREYTIFRKSNNRFAVRNAKRKWLNGDDKVALLIKHELVSAPKPKAPEPEPEQAEEAATEEAPAEEASE